MEIFPVFLITAGKSAFQLQKQTTRNHLPEKMIRNHPEKLIRNQLEKMIRNHLEKLIRSHGGDGCLFEVAAVLL